MVAFRVVACPKPLCFHTGHLTQPNSCLGTPPLVCGSYKKGFWLAGGVFALLRETAFWWVKEALSGIWLAGFSVNTSSCLTNYLNPVIDTNRINMRIITPNLTISPKLNTNPRDQVRKTAKMEDSLKQIAETFTRITNKITRTQLISKIQTK